MAKRHTLDDLSGASEVTRTLGWKEVPIGQFLRDGTHVARRYEIVGLLGWIERMKRRNRWYHQLWRVFISALPWTSDRHSLIDQDPHRLIQSYVAQMVREEQEKKGS